MVMAAQAYSEARPSEAKDFYGNKEGTYHWDIGEDSFPHDMNHLQVHTYDGDIVRIFFPR